MKKVFFAAMLLCTGVVSCSTDDLASTSISEKKTDGIQLVLSVDQFTKVNTSRAIVKEALVQDVTILQFKRGKVVKTKYIANPVTSTPIELGTDWESMDLATTKVKTDQYGKETTYVDEDVNDMNCIVALANIGSDKTSECNGKSYQTWFKSFSAEFEPENAEVLPMIGRYTAGLQKGVTNQVGITLYRTVAKVNYTVNTDNFSINGTKPSAISVRSVTLCNVPKNITYYDAYRYNRPALPANGEAGLWPETQSPYPTYSVDNWYEELPMENQSTTTNNWVFYMPSNVRGSYDGITSNADKYPSKLKQSDSNNLNQDDASFTYLNVIVDYTTKSGAAKSATYKVYLGGDSKGDMNILNNTQYTVTTNLYGANTADTRITANATEFDPTDNNDNMPKGVLGMANCYMIDMSASSSAMTVKALSRAGETAGTLNKTSEITIPLAQVRNGWQLIDQYDNAVKDGEQTDHVSEIEKIIKNGEYKFKLIWKTQQTGGTFSGQAATFGEGDFKDKGNFYGKLSFNGFSNGNSALVGIYYKPKTKTDVTQQQNEDAASTAFKSGDLLWSWHIWFTDYDPDTVNESYYGDGFTLINGAFYGKKMMSLNLGASVQEIIKTPSAQPTSDGQKYWGFYYQYGRKDPQGMAESSSAFVKKYNAAGTEYPDSIKVVNSGVPLAYANMTPGQFFSMGSSGGIGDWSVPGVKGTNNDYWNGANMNKSKSPFDPCPAGWRVPMSGNDSSVNPWAGFGDDNNSSVGSGITNNYFSWKGVTPKNNNAGRLYTVSQNNVTYTGWYPASGYRNGGSGALTSVGSSGYSWSASANSNTGARYLNFGSTSVGPQSLTNRACGFPVRCVQE